MNSTVLYLTLMKAIRKMSRKQSSFEDVYKSLNPEALKIFQLPNYAQTDENLVNMANFYPLIKDLIMSVSPKSICEIGSDLGATTRLLSDYCYENSCTLHSVDPAFDKTERKSQLVYTYKMTSFEYLKNNQASQVYFIDGDHNFHTVFNELNLIKSSLIRNEEVVVFLHDVGWPCAYIDMYYDCSSIPEELRSLSHKNSIVKILKDEYSQVYEGLPMDQVSVVSPSSESSGVLSAVMEFLKKDMSSEFFKIPSIYGFGVLILNKDVAGEVYAEFSRLKNICSKFDEFLSILEFNRVRLLEKINTSGKLWERQQNYISKLEKQIEVVRAENKMLSDIIKESGHE